MSNFSTLASGIQVLTSTPTGDAGLALNGNGYITDTHILSSGANAHQATPALSGTFYTGSVNSIISRDSSGNFGANNIYASTITATTVVASSITGTWTGGIIPPSHGGTGNNNSGSTLYFDSYTSFQNGGYSFQFIGASSGSANVSVTVPISGTLLSTSTVISPIYGGTGIANNSSSTLTISGNFTTTITVTGTTAITLPTSGSLPSIVADTNLTGQTSATTVATYATPASNKTYSIGGYVAIQSIITDVLNFQVAWTDENNNSQSSLFVDAALGSPNMGATGFYVFSPIYIRVKSSTTITISTVLATGGGAINYDVGGTIILI